ISFAKWISIHAWPTLSSRRAGAPGLSSASHHIARPLPIGFHPSGKSTNTSRSTPPCHMIHSFEGKTADEAWHKAALALLQDPAVTVQESRAGKTHELL